MKRSKRMLMACILLLVGGAGLAWLYLPSGDIRRARADYEQLTVGMSEAEVNAILGKPGHNGKLYGYWSEDLQWYVTRSDPPPPGYVGYQLYTWYQWNYGKKNRHATDGACIGMILDKNKVLAFWHSEDHENLAEKQLMRLAAPFSINTSFLDRGKSRTSHDHRMKR